jgi:hypothetical protein
MRWGAPKRICFFLKNVFKRILRDADMFPQPSREFLCYVAIEGK